MIENGGQVQEWLVSKTEFLKCGGVVVVLPEL